MSQLPAGWTWADTASVAEVQGGIQKQPKRVPRNNRYPFLRVANVPRGRLDLRDVHEIELFDGELEKFRLCRGDLLVVEGNGSPDQIGRSALWHGEIENCVHQNHLIRVRPTAAIEPKFLDFYWNSAKATDYLRSIASSTSGLYVLTSAKVRGVRIPLAPFEEQERIVAAIEEQFSRLDAGVAALERVRQNLKRMRAAAFLDLDLAASHRAEPKVLRSVAEFIVDGDHNPPKRVASGIPYLTAKHVKQGRIMLDGATCVSIEDFERLRRRYEPQAGDVLVTCVGTLGQIAVVPAGLTFAADRNLAAIRPTSGILSRYLAAMLQSPRQQKVLAIGSGSTAQPHLYLKDLRAVSIPLPAVATQEELVVVLHERLVLIDRLEADLNRIASRTNALRSSILAAAFSGELAPQDTSDEPASVMLERITTDRVSSNGYKPSRNYTRRARGTT